MVTRKRTVQFPLHLENSALLASVGIPAESPSNQPICTKLVNTVPRAAVCPFQNEQLPSLGLGCVMEQKAGRITRNKHAKGYRRTNTPTWGVLEDVPRGQLDWFQGLVAERRQACSVVWRGKESGCSEVVLFTLYSFPENYGYTKSMWKNEVLLLYLMFWYQILMIRPTTEGLLCCSMSLFFWNLDLPQTAGEFLLTTSLTV